MRLHTSSAFGGPRTAEIPAARRSLLGRRALFGAMVLLLVLALVLPAVPQPAHYHAFADQRGWAGWPHAAGVLSNLGFVLAGCMGLVSLRRVGAARMGGTARAMCMLFFVGLLSSGAGSAVYHWAPQDGSLVWDRLGMSLAFAGLLGLAVQTRLDDASARATAASVLLAAPLGVLIWARTGNVLPWALVQAGGMLLVGGLAFLAPRRRALPLGLGWVLGLYALAKLLELSDAAVFAATGGLVSGHSLKHVMAAAAAWPVLQALRKLRTS
ncbi:hypothetical protein [Comamonas guangdongensis]|uniref:Alkaline phytoceramidase n=1 Tax=Comamonas guangdongensis TaxID=510515 RepID=A0ABV3ZRF7_9BURK